VTTFEAVTMSAISALTVALPSAFTWFGERSEAPSDLRAADTRAELARRMQDRLYADFYVHGRARPTPVHTASFATVTPEAEALRQRLRGANASRLARQSGWSVVAVEQAGRTVVERDGFKVWVHQSQMEPPHAPPLGAGVTLLVPPEQLRISPGFYSVLGEHELRIADAPLTRVYWHVTAAQAPELLATLTTSLNAQRIAFRLKMCDRPDTFERCDACVLYLTPDDWPKAEDAIQAVYEALGPLAPDVPAFTRRLADGVAVAEDEGGGTSFGMSRCAILADALVAAAESNIDTPTERLGFVSDFFARRGVDPERPHLRSHRKDPYRVWQYA
jgi:hypothetical protein